MWCDPVQLHRQVPGKVPVQRLGQVPDGSGADGEVRFREVLVQRLGQVPGGSGPDTQVRIRGYVLESSGAETYIGEVPVQRPRSGSGKSRCTHLGQVPQGSGTEVR